MRFPSTNAVLALSLAATCQLAQAADAEAASDVITLTTESFPTTVNPEVSNSIAFSRLQSSSRTQPNALELTFSILILSPPLCSAGTHASGVLCSLVWTLSSFSSSRQYFNVSHPSNHLCQNLCSPEPTSPPLNSTRKPRRNSRMTLLSLEKWIVL